MSQAIGTLEQRVSRLERALLESPAIDQLTEATTLTGKSFVGYDPETGAPVQIPVTLLPNADGANEAAEAAATSADAAEKAATKAAEAAESALPSDQPLPYSVTIVQAEEKDITTSRGIAAADLGYILACVSDSVITLSLTQTLKSGLPIYVFNDNESGGKNVILTGGGLTENVIVEPGKSVQGFRRKDRTINGVVRLGIWNFGEVVTQLALPELDADPASFNLLTTTAENTVLAEIGLSFPAPAGTTADILPADGRYKASINQAGKVVIQRGATAIGAGDTNWTVRLLNPATSQIPTRIIQAKASAPAAVVPFRVPISEVTVTGSTDDAGNRTALLASVAAKSSKEVKIAVGGTAKIVLTIGAILQHGAEINFANMVNKGAATWTFAVRRSFDNGATWATLTGLPYAGNWAPWAPAGNAAAFNDRPQAFHVPAGAASLLELTIGNSSTLEIMRWDWRGLRDMNSDERLIIGLMGNSRATSGEKALDWISELRSRKASLDPMVMELHRGSATVIAIKTEMADYFVARFPRFTHLAHLENGNCTSVGAISSAGVPASQDVTDRLAYWDTVYDFYAQYPGRVFVGPSEAKLHLATAAQDTWQAINTPLDGPGSSSGTFALWNRWQRCPKILARASLKATSWDDALGCMRGGWDVMVLDDWENILGSDGNHISGTTPNAKQRRGSEFIFNAIAGIAYKAPIVRLIEEAEAVKSVTAARRARLILLMDYLDAFTPQPTTAQATARAALRNRINAIPLGTGTVDPGTGITGQISEVANASSGTGQPITFTLSRSPKAASYAVLVNHDQEVQRVSLATDAVEVVLTPTVASATNPVRYYVARYYDTASDELIDETKPFTVVDQGSTAKPVNSTVPGTPRGLAMQGELVGPNKTNPNGTWANNPTDFDHRWVTDSGVAAGSALVLRYAPVAGDVGKTLYHETKGKNAAGTADIWARSASGIGPVVAPGASAPIAVKEFEIVNGGQGGGTLAAPRPGDILTVIGPILAGHGSDGAAPFAYSNHAFRRTLPNNGGTTSFNSLPNSTAYSAQSYTIQASDAGCIFGYTQPFRTVVNNPSTGTPENKNLPVLVEAQTGAVVA